MKRKALNQEVLPFVGKPSMLIGSIEKSEDWTLLKIDPNKIKIVSSHSKI